MSQRQPWWYSGGEDDAPGVADAQPTAPPDTPGAAPVDWTALLTGAQRIVDWATDRVIAPHSQHDDPRNHPDCMVCRTLLVAERFDIDLPRPWSFGSTASPAPTDHVESDAANEAGVDGDREDPDQINWIPIVDESAVSRP